MRDTARYAAMDVPEDNPHFRRGHDWHLPDRLPHQRPRRAPVRSLERLSAELLAALPRRQTLPR